MARRVAATSSHRHRRATIAKIALISILSVHAALLVRAGTDPHKLFGFRPFNESDTWQADIVRVTVAGDRLPIDDGTWAYDWDDLVGTPELVAPERNQHAEGGADSIVDFLDRALDWTVDNTPDDQQMVALEATVTVYRNSRAPETILLRSERRDE